MSKARDLADFISTGSILSDGTIESTEISGVTADATEINKLDGLTADTTELNTLDGVTATTAELNKLAGTTATTSDFDKLSNVTASATELNYMTGATSSIQSQLDNISVTSGSLTKSFTSGESATITLAQSITPAPVVSVTKEVAQTGQSSKGAWDVNATASNYDLHNTAYDTTLAKGSISVTSDVSGSSYDSVTFSVASQQGDPQGCTFGDNGYKLYVAGKQPQAVHQYNLTTAYDLSTASYASKVLSTSANSNNTRAVEFKSDGTVAYVMDDQGGQLLIYNLSTAWDISTAGSPTAFGLSANGRGIAFKPDGTKFYFGSNTDVKEYTLSTAWDTSTATLTHTASGITATELAEIALSSDGSRLYILNRNGNNIEDYTLSTAYDLSTVSSQVSTFSTASQDSDEQGIMLNGDDSKIYMIGKTNDLIYQYTNSTTATDALVLGTGSFASTDIGKRIQGNGGDVILTSTAGAYDTTGGSDFTDTSTIASGSWTMHGLKSAGASSGLTIPSLAGAGYSVAGASYTNNYYDTPDSNTLDGIFVNEAGTRLYKLDGTATDLWEYSLSTAHDITTASQTGNRIAYSGVGPGETDMRGMGYKPDGTRLYLSGSTFHRIYMYNTNAFDIGTNAHAGNGPVDGTHQFPGGIALKPDGTKLFHTSGSSNMVAEYSLGTAWDFSTNVTFNGAYNAGAQLSSPSDVKFNDDGTKMYVLDATSKRLGIYSLSTAYTITSGVTHDGNLDLSTHATNLFGLSFSNSGANMYIGGRNGNVYQYSTQEVTAPTSSYHLAVTNSGGQIDSSFWTDINSMTADQSLGDGEAYYAVSTDDRTTWSVAKASDGVRPIVRNNAGTWQYNNDQGTTTGFSIANGSYDSKSFSVASQDTAPRGMTFNNDGTKMYIGGDANDEIFEYVLSTANDISTASYNSVGLNIGSQDAAIQGITFNNDGTQLYMLGSGNDSVFQYTLTTAFDLSTASYASKTINVSSQDIVPRGLAFKPDGTKMYIVGGSSLSILQYSLSTADDLSTASYDSVSFGITGITSLSSMAFNNDGTKMFVYGYANGDAVQQYSLSTAYDISTASYDSVSFSLVSQDGNVQSIEFSSDGTKMFASGDANNTIFQYSTEAIGFTTSTTWANATTNDEFYALQEALGATSVNRMDKTQLDAVADGSHFTLGDTLDLAIALKQDTASASLPTSDGVSINYDAEALNQGAVLGTDYDYDFPDSTTVRITSNAAQNLKIRVV